MIKRLFDIAVAALALLVAAPFIVVAAIGIMLTSPGPIFYRARRAGRDGALFTMYKLRTMHVAQTEASSITSPGAMGATLGLAAGFAAGAAFAGAVGAALAGVAAVGVYVDHRASDAAFHWINCAGDIL